MDLPPLMTFLLDQFARAFGKPVPRVSPEVMTAFLAYGWPGNVRELQNEIQRMIALSDTHSLGSDLLSSRVRALVRDDPVSAAIDASQNSPPPLTAGGLLPTEDGDGITLREHVEALEERLLRAALERYQGNISRAADALGLSRLGLRGKLRRYGLDRESHPDRDG